MIYSSPSIFSTLCSSLLLLQYASAISSGQLGIQINDGVARGNTKRLLYGSIATITDLSDWTDEQIVDMAFVAHDDMRKAHGAIDFSNYPGLSKKVPGVTTTLVVDNTAYISSTMGGGAYLYLPNGNTGSDQSRFTDLDPAHPCAGAVQDALTRCQANSVNFSGHRTGASCGEPMAALAFCATHVQRDLRDAKIVSIIGKSNYKIVVPCGNPNGQLLYDGEWGCHDFTTETGLGMHVIPENTQRTATDVSSDDISITYAAYP